MEPGGLRKIADELIGKYRPTKRSRKKFVRKARTKNKRAKKLGLPITDPFTLLEIPAPQRKLKVHYLHLMECVEDKRGERWYQCVGCRARLRVTSKRLQQAKYWSPQEQFVIIDEGRPNGKPKRTVRKRTATRVRGTGKEAGQ